MVRQLFTPSFTNLEMPTLFPDQVRTELKRNKFLSDTSDTAPSSAVVFIEELRFDLHYRRYTKRTKTVGRGVP